MSEAVKVLEPLRRDGSLAGALMPMKYSSSDLEQYYDLHGEPVALADLMESL